MASIRVLVIEFSLFSEVLLTACLHLQFPNEHLQHLHSCDAHCLSSISITIPLQLYITYKYLTISH
uniref:Uncharacterized protein n=1 Tax=Anguilla anguilla TaxID=7936 RepID=A0A0E9WXZ7_ANGAN